MKWHNSRAKWSERKDRVEQNLRRLQAYWENPGPDRERIRRYRIDNPDKVRANDRAEYQRNKLAHQMRVERYRKSHPDLWRKVYANERSRYPWRRALINAAHRSAKKDFAFELDRAWCEARWTGSCELSGVPFVFGSQTHFSFSPSIDRIDSTKGYTQDNCRFILFALNSFKGIGTDEQMFEIAKSLILHQNAAPASPYA